MAPAELRGQRHLHHCLSHTRDFPSRLPNWPVRRVPPGCDSSQGHKAGLGVRAFPHLAELLTGLRKMARGSPGGREREDVPGRQRGHQPCAPLSPRLSLAQPRAWHAEAPAAPCGRWLAWSRPQACTRLGQQLWHGLSWANAGQREASTGPPPVPSLSTTQLLALPSRVSVGKLQPLNCITPVPPETSAVINSVLISARAGGGGRLPPPGVPAACRGPSSWPADQCHSVPGKETRPLNPLRRRQRRRSLGSGRGTEKRRTGPG